MVKGAILDGKRRYRLWRIWDPEKPLLLYVLLNPSHADAQTDDRTVAKLIQFSRDWGYGGFYLGNIHSYITSDPKLLVHHLIPNEPLNIFHLKEMAKKSKKKSRRSFIHHASGTMGIIAASVAGWPLIDQMNPSKDVEALATRAVRCAAHPLLLRCLPQQKQRGSKSEIEGQDSRIVDVKILRAKNLLSMDPNGLCVCVCD